MRIKETKCAIAAPILTNTCQSLRQGAEGPLDLLRLAGLSIAGVIASKDSRPYLIRMESDVTQNQESKTGDLQERRLSLHSPHLKSHVKIGKAKRSCCFIVKNGTQDHISTRASKMTCLYSYVDTYILLYTQQYQHPKSNKPHTHTLSLTPLHPHPHLPRMFNHPPRSHFVARAVIHNILRVEHARFLALRELIHLRS